MQNPVDPPFLVALNLTRRCNLACAHCYLDAGTRKDGGPEELQTGEVTGLLDQIAALSDETMVVLTGGEPLLRPDILGLAHHASELGLMVVIGTNGTLLDERRVGALQDAGVRAVGISLDSLDSDYHDDFRGRPGSWAKTMEPPRAHSAKKGATANALSPRSAGMRGDAEALGSAGAAGSLGELLESRDSRTGSNRPPNRLSEAK